jgi:hypothetical protein
MQRFSSAVLAIFAGAAMVCAHQDPAGDNYPNVKIENGNFVVCFTNNLVTHDPLHGPVYRVVYSSAGEILAPRHLRPDLSSERFGNEFIENMQINLGDEALKFTYGFHDRDAPLRYESTHAGKTESHTLPWPEKSKCLIAATAGDADSIGLAIIKQKVLWLYHFDRRRTDPPVSVCLPRPPFIYDSPVISNLIKVGSRYCIAWIKFDEAEKKHHTVITTWKPTEKEPNNLVLSEPSNWNTSLSMAAVGHRICLTYHCSIEGDYPGVGQIITVFRDIPND